MRNSSTVSLAWSNLTYDRVRLLLFTLGISFAVVLMFVQYGFMNALLDSNTQLMEALDGELVIVDHNFATLAIHEPFPRERLTRARGNRSVAAAHEIYLETSLSALRGTSRNVTERFPRRQIRVIGIDPRDSPLRLREVTAEELSELAKPDTALFDKLSKPGPIPGLSVFGPLETGIQSELSGRSITLVGDFALGSDFGAEGSLVLSKDTFRAHFRSPLFPLNHPDDMEIGLLRLHPNSDTRAVQRELQAVYPENDVDVLTIEEFSNREKAFWRDSTPIGEVFGLGMLIGFIVGCVICYQILESDISDHLGEYATLRAMGYSQAYLSRVVVQESIYLALFGFVPGLLIALGAYMALEMMTGLPMRLTIPRAGVILLLTLVMCICSALLAVRKAQQADPAEVF